jgi:hypothetical protein
MRTTIDLPPDLHDALKALALHGRGTLSQAAVNLMRRGLGREVSATASELALDPLTGLTVVRLGRRITADDVRALDDEP